jgi:2-keto-4-pentenoate hydratase/2-oxohepta-3-ene-1,7-dioic acid hydratase in catechol pathway
MRLATYEAAGGLRPAVAVGERLVDVERAAQRAGLPVEGRGLGSVRALLAEHPDDLERLEEAAQAVAAAGDGIALADVRVGPPVPDPDKILCVGLNYREHASEASLDEPDVPLIFAKFPNVLIGDGAPIRLPPANAAHVDYEGEVAVVIGRRIYGADERRALDAVAGWMPFNDVTARDLQTQTSQWTVGKSPDTFGPCGPCLVVDRALHDGGLELQTRVNGEVVQHAHTDQMIFSVARIVAFLSRTMTLVPGDIVVTGTPQGVGAHRSPARYLAGGDVVEITVGGERLSNPVMAP